LNELYLKVDVKELADRVINGLWKGKDAEPFFTLIRKAEYNKGVKDTIKRLKELGFYTCILTTGPIELAKRVQVELKIDFVYGNEMKIKNGVITGEYNWLFLDFDKKGEFLQKICNEHGFNLDDIIVVGDNEQDVYKFRVAGKSIAFNSKCEDLKKEADHVVEGNDLRGILKFIE